MFKFLLRDMIVTVALCFPFLASAANAQGGSPDPIPNVEAVAPLTLSSNKAAVCAGAIDTEPHRAVITALVRSNNGGNVSGKNIRFTVQNSDSGYPAYIKDASVDGSKTVVTGSNGETSITLISSQAVGSTATVKGSFKNIEHTTDVIMADAKGEMVVDADQLIADGQSEADVYLSLTHEGEPVEGHNITFRISSVINAEGKTVQSASDGTFPGYGSIRTVQGTSDDAGVSYGIYTSGILPGVITFESADHSSLVSAMGSGAPSGNINNYSVYQANSANTVSTVDKKPSVRYQDTKPKLEVMYPTASFFFVSDSAVPKHSTAKNEASVPPIIKGANKAWYPPHR